MAQPAYHFRPNKTVDRYLFCETIRHLRTFDLADYRYIGFGSYEFDEFKLIHRSFGIRDMHSIERDPEIFKRQRFNKPYSFIQLYNKKCSEYIDEDFDPRKKCIFWLDFSDANDKVSQFEDVSTLISKCNQGDIIRVTLNAQPSSIIDKSGDQQSNIRKLRFNSLRSNLSDIFPRDATEESVTIGKLPYLLLQILHNAAYKYLSTDLAVCPICAYSYSDGQQMLTSTMIIVPNDNKEQYIKNMNESFSDWLDFVNLNSWKDIVHLNLPNLTIHEQLELSQIDDNSDRIKKASEQLGVSEKEIKEFLRLIRYYPNYRNVVI